MWEPNWNIYLDTNRTEWYSLPSPDKEEIITQLNRLKNNKIPREDEIQGEILKNLDEGTIKRIHSIIENIWSEERLPADWGTIYIYILVCPIYKKWHTKLQ